VFSLPQTPVESPAEVEAPGLEYLPEAEWPQAGPEPLRRPLVVAAVVPRQELRDVEKPPPLSSVSLKQHQAPPRNTTAAAAGKSAVWVALALELPFLPYQITFAARERF
jgi:hypothetical protein